jgi:asparagine synthase (glutamine-hydrolysing)
MNPYILVIDRTGKVLNLEIVESRNSNNNKFDEDCVYIENDKYHIYIEGVVLNKHILMTENKCNSWENCIIGLYGTYGAYFFKHLKGSYTGFVFDKSRKAVYSFTDQIGSRPLYHATVASLKIVSNSFQFLVEFLKKRSDKISLDERSAYLLLTYGYVFDTATIFNEVRRLAVGDYMLTTINQIKFDTYYRIENTPKSSSEADAIDGIDYYFRKAVQLAFEKDKEYNYEHFVSLSGGLDSRMTSWVAHDLGFTNQVNVTFSQSNYYDETIPKKIASDLKHEWIFKSLDNGNFLYDLDTINLLTGGNVLFSSAAHSYSLYKYINFENFGLLHTGQLGDVIISSFFSSSDYTGKANIGDGAYSKRLIDRLDKNKFNDLKAKYNNEELFMLNLRGCYGANQGLIVAQNFTETYSPFYDIDLISFALSIPPHLRINHRIYKKWILNKYPGAANYIWEKIGTQISNRYRVTYKSRDIYAKNLGRIFLKKLGRQTNPMNTTKHMNPFDYWLKTNSNLDLFLSEYFRENIGLLQSHPNLFRDASLHFTTGNAIEKCQVLTLLSVCKLFLT